MLSLRRQIPLPDVSLLFSGEAMKRFGIGQPVRRVDDARFLTGRGRYAADIDLPEMAHSIVPVLH
jgi:hypothetical protein